MIPREKNKIGWNLFVRLIDFIRTFAELIDDIWTKVVQIHSELFISTLSRKVVGIMNLVN